MVPKHLTSRIIGQKGKQIQEIIDKSKVIKVRFPSDQETRAILTKEEVAKNTIIIFVGTKNNILNAECLMDYLVGSLAEIDQMSDDKNTLEKVWFISLSALLKQIRHRFFEKIGIQHSSLVQTFFHR